MSNKHFDSKQFQSLKFKSPRSHCIVGNSFSGKTFYVRYIIKNNDHFSGDDNKAGQVRDLYIITDEFSKDSWSKWCDEVLKKNVNYVVYTYLDLKNEDFMDNIRKNSVVVIDDLSDDCYRIYETIINRFLDVLCHHLNLQIFCLVQNLLSKHLKRLILKVNEIHLSTSNQSSYSVVRYLSTYYYPSHLRSIILKSLSLINKFKSNRTTFNDFIVFILKKDLNSCNSYRVIINKLGHISSTELCIALSEEEQPWIKKLQNEKSEVDDTYGLFDYKHNCYVPVRDLLSLEPIVNGCVKGEKMENNSDEFVMVPLSIYDYILEQVIQDNSRRGEAICDDKKNQNIQRESKYRLLKENIETNVKNSFPIKKLSSAKRLSNEIYINKYFTFIGTSRRVFVINSEADIDKDLLQDYVKKFKRSPIDEKITTIDFISNIIKRPCNFIAAKNKKKKKINLLYKIATILLIKNDCPLLLINNIDYIKK